MSSKRGKKKRGSLGPTPAWLRLSVAQRQRLKVDIKQGFRGDELSPGLRRMFSGYTAGDGYDLRHIERWSAQKIEGVRRRLAVIRTLSSRPHVVKTPSNARQKKQLRYRTGQTLKRQKSYIVHVTDAAVDRVQFQKGKLTEVRQLKSGAKKFERLYLFKDFNKGVQPTTFKQMISVTKRMLKVMPETKGKNDVFYVLNTIEHGNIGAARTKPFLLRLIEDYHNTYDSSNQHKGFGETVLGFYMTGSDVQTQRERVQRDKSRQFYKRNKKLRFTASIKSKVKNHAAIKTRLKQKVLAPKSRSRRKTRKR